MHKTAQIWLSAVLAVLPALPVAAQAPTTPGATPTTAAPTGQTNPTPANTAPVAPPVLTPSTAIAAVVNGENIPENAVQRALVRVPPIRQEQARKEIVEYLVDNLVIDQYLRQVNVAADPKEIEKRIAQIKDEIMKEKQDFEKVMQGLLLSPDELKAQIAADIRWEVFATGKATDAVLKELFAKEPEMFDGSTVRARHILLSPKSADPKEAEQLVASLQAIKQQVDGLVAAGLQKVPAGTDALAKEKERVKLLEESFSNAAKEKSMCPSGKTSGGDVGAFPRIGAMVEPFAKAGFATKVYTISDVVKTQYGYHLILPIDRKNGEAPKFEKVTEEVKEVYCSRLRTEIANQLRAQSKVSINPPPVKTPVSVTPTK